MPRRRTRIIPADSKLVTWIIGNQLRNEGHDWTSLIFRMSIALEKSPCHTQAEVTSTLIHSCSEHLESVAQEARQLLDHSVPVSGDIMAIPDYVTIARITDALISHDQH